MLRTKDTQGRTKFTKEGLRIELPLPFEKDYINPEQKIDQEHVKEVRADIGEDRRIIMDVTSKNDADNYAGD